MNAVPRIAPDTGEPTFDPPLDTGIARAVGVLVRAGIETFGNYASCKPS